MKAPLITMSAITGKPTRDEIFEYMKSLKDNGICQVMAYPRSGCEVDYLEEEWFVTVGHFVDAATELCMNLWLYDDFNWPSGDAHGRVSKLPEYRLKAVCTKGENIGKIDYYSKNKGSLFGEKYFPDLLGDKAMDYFIECTHEKYYKHFGKYFGTLIKGFFTDEPGVGYCCNEESMPYYDGLDADYKSECGRDFFEDMKKDHEDFYAVSLYLIGKRYRKCFLGKISDWCEKHGVVLTGHLMEDTTPHGATKQCGDILKALSTFGIPGVDELRTKFKDLCIYNLFGSVQYGRRNKKGAMAELFALGPCDISFANKRSIIYLASCFGINHYFLAVSHMDMRGNTAITDYFNNFTADVPNFGGTKILAEDAKIASMLAEKDYVPKVLIRYPTRICAKHLHSELNLMKFFKLVNYFTYNQIPWKYVDDGDETGNIPVVEFTEELDYIIDGKAMEFEQVLEKFKVSSRVTDMNGNVDEGIFVREYSDGTTVVLNLYAKPDIYLVDGKKVYLEENAVRVYDGKAQEDAPVTKTEIDVTFDVNYCNDNMIRVMIINDETKAHVVCENDKEVTFAVRRGVNATKDEKAIDGVTENSPLLFNGIKKLYNLSEKMTLQQGTHIIETSDDKKYLPSVFVIGDFACETESGDVCKVTLFDRATKFVPGQQLCDYGKVELSSKIQIADNAKAIEFEGATLYTELYFDDTAVGEKIYPPFVFEIPDEYRGKDVTMKLVQYSSLGPIFGDVEYYTQNSKSTNWITPSPTTAKYGMEKVNFIN